MYNRKRGTGKTSMAIRSLEKNKGKYGLISPVVVVGNHVQRRYYPEDVRHLVFSAAELGVDALLQRLKGIRPSVDTVIFDDSLLQMDFAKSCQYMYELGRHGYYVEVLYTDNTPIGL